MSMCSGSWYCKVRASQQPAELGARIGTHHSHIVDSHDTREDEVGQIDGTKVLSRGEKVSVRIEQEERCRAAMESLRRGRERREKRSSETHLRHEVVEEDRKGCEGAGAVSFKLSSR
jgi:hypothetical protein